MAPPGLTVSSVADADSARRDRAGHHEPDPLQGEGAVDRHPEETRCDRLGPLHGGDNGGFFEMSGQRGDAIAGAARHREYQAVGITGRGQQFLDSADDLLDPVGRGAVNLGDNAGDLGHPDQLEDVEMLDRLRTRPVIGGDDQQYAVDRQHPGQHVG